MVKQFDYNRILTPETVFRGIALLHWPWHRLFHFVFIVTVAHGPVGVSIPQKSADKPYKQHKRNGYSHNHIPYFIAQVHKDANNIKCLYKC